MADETEIDDLPQDSPPEEEAAAAATQDLQEMQPNGEGDENPVLGQSGDEPVPVRSATDLAAVFDVPVNVSAVLGKTSMQVSSLLKLSRGAVLELDRKVGEAIDIYVNNRLVARGEVVIVEERLGVTMTEIIKSDVG